MADNNSLVADLTAAQRKAVTASVRRLLVVAGAGSGKTEVMARRIAYWVTREAVAKDQIVAFTFTEKAAEEMKFRIRSRIEKNTPAGGDPTLGGMYVGTIHSFCIRMLRDLRPDGYGTFDIIDDVGRLALAQRGFHFVLGLSALKEALAVGQYRAIGQFLLGYDLLNEYGLLDVDLPPGPIPSNTGEETEWVKRAKLRTRVGTGPIPNAFAKAAGRYYAYLRARRFFDFSTAQAELVRLLESDPASLGALRARFSRVVVDEVQDINPIQDRLIRLLLGDSGFLTAVGDHRQAIFGWRGGRVDIMADLYAELDADPDAHVIDLSDNFRSTPRIVGLANGWARTIGALGTMATPPMTHGLASRTDRHAAHTAVVHFPDRQAEAGWIADAIGKLVTRRGTGTFHDVPSSHGTPAGERGIGYSDVAVLVRSTTDVRTYMEALQAKGIPCVVRGGPDLFAQPEVLLMLAALGKAAGIDTFWGAGYRSMNSISRDILGCNPEPDRMIPAALKVLAAAGLPVAGDTARRVATAADLIAGRLDGSRVPRSGVGRLKTEPLRSWLGVDEKPRRIFPQTLFQWLAAEAGIADWDASASARAGAAMFHLGQFSTLIAGIESPGWVRPGDFKWHIIALAQWGPGNARTEEAPLLVPPDAVTISTIHSAKGLEFPVVFLADVTSSRFPNARARQTPDVPLRGVALRTIDPTRLADNDNYDDERRLMYVALTRAQRYLFVSTSGSRRSRFISELDALMAAAGGMVGDHPMRVPSGIRLLPTVSEPTFRLVTSFSDLRYYLECPHDYYLRKVLGFAPTIDQAFGYGRAVHNLMREVHREPARWAELAADRAALEAEIHRLTHEGPFYLRYTTGVPLDNMRAKATAIASDYVLRYREELAGLTFEPEREFETLIEEVQVLVSGAIDLIRRDDPPMVTLIDFKSGDPDSDAAQKLDEEEMRLQISIYGLAARRELEYLPDQGLVRYLDTKAGDGNSELAIPLDEESLAAARATVVQAVGGIQQRHWNQGPARPARRDPSRSRCHECDFGHICGRPGAAGQAVRAGGRGRRPARAAPR